MRFFAFEFHVILQSNSDLDIRPAGDGDHAAIWRLLEPVIRGGETYALPRDMVEGDALATWMSAGHEVFLAVLGPAVVGTYYLRANQLGGGSHVANCGYVTDPAYTGRGIGRSMCLYSLRRARDRGFSAMQYNLVVASNTRAIALWEQLGFRTVGVLPGAFAHPSLGMIDALVMYRELDTNGVS